MFRLIYASKALQAFDEPALQQLAVRASQKNRKLRITGFLSFKKDRFVQFLEGRREDVLQLMTEIEQDPRHQILRLLQLGPSQERIFPTWNMQFLHEHFFHEIQLEDVLESILLFLLDGPYSEAQARQSIQNIVYSIAARHPPGYSPRPPI